MGMGPLPRYILSALVSRRLYRRSTLLDAWNSKLLTPLAPSRRASGLWACLEGSREDHNRVASRKCNAQQDRLRAVNYGGERRRTEGGRVDQHVEVTVPMRRRGARSGGADAGNTSKRQCRCRCRGGEGTKGTRRSNEEKRQEGKKKKIVLLIFMTLQEKPRAPPPALGPRGQRRHLGLEETSECTNVTPGGATPLEVPSATGGWAPGGGGPVGGGGQRGGGLFAGGGGRFCMMN